MATNPPPEEKELDSFNSGSESTRRKRTVFTKEQVAILKFYFQRNRYPGIGEREQLSRLTNISEDRLHVWFQNRRARQSAQEKKLASEASASLRPKCPEEVSPDASLEDDFSEQEFSTPNESMCTSWAGDPNQKADPSSGCNFERNTSSIPEAAYLYGHGISESHPSVSSQTMGSSIDLQSCALSMSMSHGSSNEWASSLALQSTQGPENWPENTLQPPLHIQEQNLYPNDHPLSYWCTQESPYQLQQPLSQQFHTQQNCLQQSFPQQPFSHQLCPQQPYIHQSPPQQPAALQPLMPQAPHFSGTTADLMPT